MNNKMNKSSKLISVEKHLEGLKSINLCPELNDAVSQWESVLEIDTYIKDGVLHITDSTYCDIMTFVRWELNKLNRMMCECQGLFSKDVKMNLV